MTQAVSIAQSGSNNTTFRNRIINGGMMIDQRNAGASVTPTDGQYTVDRFSAGLTQASKFSVQQSTTAPTGFVNSLVCTSLSAYSVGSSDTFLIQQNIEGLNCSDLGWGTASAATVTLSFWVRSSLTGTFGGALKNSAANRSYPFTYTISSANTWEQKSVTIAGDTSGTWLTTNGIGIRVIFGLGAGSSFSGTTGSWQAGNLSNATGATSVVGTNGATFYITGVQLEKGTTATPFEQRLYGTELALCQRYCYVCDSRPYASGYYSFGLGYNTGATGFDFLMQFPVPMRTKPSLSTSTVSGFYADGLSTGSISSISLDQIGVESGNAVAVGGSVGRSAGAAGRFLSNNNNTSWIQWSAEL